jgi:hypothetical protein
VVHVIVAVNAVVEMDTADIAGGFSTFTVVLAEMVFPEVSVMSAQRVVEPFTRDTVFHGMEYNVPLAVEVDPMRVLDASVAP